jgi:hypothetical protein
MEIGIPRSSHARHVPLGAAVLFSDHMRSLLLLAVGFVPGFVLTLGVVASVERFAGLLG